MSGKILVCDDDTGVADVIKLVLESNGYEVLLLSNGKLILKKIEEFRPKLILLDIWMPGIDGRDITKHLKQDPTFKNIPVVLISALNGVKEMARTSGADDFLEKPFGMEDLLYKVKSNIQ